VNTTLPTNVLLFGAECAPAPEVLLRAGPLHLIFREGVFRYIKLENREVIRAVYFAVRDENWRTIPGILSNLEISTATDSFNITYNCMHQEKDIDFRWKADIRGEADGSIVWRMEGFAFTSFLKNRIGFCVLHPIDESIGEPCQITHTNGAREQNRFPVTVAPHQPFRDIAAMSFRIDSNLDAELSFAGDVFETEDQRNWTDASFKTYSTPLSLPYPVRIEEGTRITQSVRLALRGCTLAAIDPPATDGEVTVTLHPDVRTPLPGMGFKWPRSSQSLSEIGEKRLDALRANHVSVDLHQGDAASEAEFWEAAGVAGRLGLPIEVRLCADFEPFQLKGVLNELASRKTALSSWLVDVQLQLSARIDDLRALEAIAPVAVGAGAHYAELNRNRPSIFPDGGVWFSLNPQVHATDDTTLVENLAAQSSVLASIRAWAGSVPITVSPVTLRTRAAASFTHEPLSIEGYDLPEDVDHRQCSLLGAGWTLGSIRHLAEGGIVSVTWFEVAGCRGIMEGLTNSLLPSSFGSIRDAVFPMYHVFADVAAFKGAEVIRTESSDPMSVECLALAKPSGLRLLIANLGATQVSVQLRLEGLATHADLRVMDEDNVARFMSHPESRRQERADQLIVQDGALRFQLKPYAIATVDASHSPLNPPGDGIPSGVNL